MIAILLCQHVAEQDDGDEDDGDDEDLAANLSNLFGCGSFSFLFHAVTVSLKHGEGKVEMAAKGTKIGDAFVDINADITAVDVAVDAAKVKIESVGNTAESTGEKVRAAGDAGAGAAKKVGVGWSRFGDTLGVVGTKVSKLSAVLAKIALPVAIIASVASLARLFTLASSQASKLRAELEALEAGPAEARRQAEIGLRTSVGLERERRMIAIDTARLTEEAADKLRDRIGSQNKLFGLQLGMAGTIINQARQEIGIRDSIKNAAERTSEAINRIHSDQASLLALLDQEEAKRRKIERESIENQALLFEAQAKGPAIAIEEQIRQLHAKGKIQFDAARKAGDKELAQSIERRFTAQKALLKIRIDGINEASRAEDEADKKSAAKKKKMEAEAHQEKLRNIAERADAERRALESTLRQIEDSFDRMNKDIVVGLGGVASALQQIGDRGNSAPIIVGGGR